MLAISTTGGANDGPRNQLRTLKAGMMIPAFTRRNSHMIRKTDPAEADEGRKDDPGSRTKEISDDSMGSGLLFRLLTVGSPRNSEALVSPS